MVQFTQEEANSLLLLGVEKSFHMVAKWLQRAFWNCQEKHYCCDCRVMCCGYGCFTSAALHWAINEALNNYITNFELTAWERRSRFESQVKSWWINSGKCDQSNILFNHYIRELFIFFEVLKLLSKVTNSLVLIYASIDPKGLTYMCQVKGHIPWLDNTDIAFTLHVSAQRQKTTLF